MIRFPDWEWNYMFDAKTFFFGEGRAAVGATSLAIILALLNLTYVAGFKLADSLLQAGKQKQLLIMLGAVLGVIGVIMLIMLKQTLHIGTLAEFESDTAGLIFGNRDFLMAQGSAVILLTVGFLWVLKKPDQP